MRGIGRGEEKERREMEGNRERRGRKEEKREMGNIWKMRQIKTLFQSPTWNCLESHVSEL